MEELLFIVETDMMEVETEIDAGYYAVRMIALPADKDEFTFNAAADAPSIMTSRNLSQWLFLEIRIARLEGVAPEGWWVHFA